MKQNGKFIGLVFALLVLTVMTACSFQDGQSTRGGRAVFTMTDDAANMGAVTSVKITVDSVKVLSEQGVWTQVSAKQQTYDLLKLKASGTQVLLADYNLTSGVYKQLRLSVSKVVVTDASGEHAAKLPSGELKLVGKLAINDNSTSTAKFDFIADESLHMTGNGEYIFAPVIKLEIREKTTVDTESKDDVKIRGGKINEDVKLSMDIDGNIGIGEGFKIRKDSRLSINGDKIVEESVQGRAVFIIADDAANMGAVTSVKITVESIKVLNEKEVWMQVSSEQQTYDLLKLKASGNQMLLADVNLTNGTYRQVRLTVSKVVVTDASGEHAAKLPSGELKLVGKFVINDNSTSTIKFDFIADESLHMTGEGRYIFAPVIKLEIREKTNVEIEKKEGNDSDLDSEDEGGVNSEKSVKIRGGKINEDVKLSMDIDGKFGEGLNIRKGSKLSINGDKITKDSV